VTDKEGLVVDRSVRFASVVGCKARAVPCALSTFCRSMEGIVVCEELIQLASRAFYPDECVVILDVLVLEKYLREDEMARRVRMSAKQVRGWLQFLEGQRLVKNEALAVTTKAETTKQKQIVYWYVDLRHFVEVVRYRSTLLVETARLKAEKPSEAVAYECRRCGARYDSLDAVRHHFRCSRRLCEGEADAVLEEVRRGKRHTKKKSNGKNGHIIKGDDPNENGSRHDDGKDDDKDDGKDDVKDDDDDDDDETGAKALFAKIEDQVRPIFDLLRRLEGKDLPENRPSQNRASGLGGAAFAQPLDCFEDAEVPVKNQESSLFSANAKGQQIEVIFEDDDDDDDDGVLAGSKKKIKDEVRPELFTSVKPLPEFLNGSRIDGTLSNEAYYDDADNVAWEDAGVGDDDDDDSDDDDDIVAEDQRNGALLQKLRPPPNTTNGVLVAHDATQQQQPEPPAEPKPNGKPIRFTFGGGGTNGASTAKMRPKTPLSFRFKKSQ